jgi:signal peptidase I
MIKPAEYLTLKRMPLRGSIVKRLFVRRLSVRRFFTIYGCVLLFFLTGWGIVSQTRLMECLSDSLENIHYVIFLKSKVINRGDIVAIQDHREDHIGNLKKWPYAKRVLGIPGDHISHSENGITVIPKESLNLPLLTQTSKGKPLTPLVPLNGMVSIIPEGYLFVAGDHLQSFDSRYKEFGLVPIGKVWGKGVLTW